jgi:ATP/maltotriose-dependent transcriptional regulator MalT
MIDRCGDPMVYSAFAVNFSYGLSLAGQYEAGATWATRALDYATRLRLDFVLSHAFAVQATALLGLRKYSQAESAIDTGRIELEGRPDPHQWMNMEALQCRLLLSCGRFDEALDAISGEHTRTPVPGMQAEYLASRALALACSCQTDAANDTARHAATLSMFVQAKALISCALAIAALQDESPRAQELSVAAFQTARESGAFDALICSYRAHPRLALHIAKERGLRAAFRRVLRVAGDSDLADSLGLSEPDPESGIAALSKREREVYELLVADLTNREIAKQLFISDVTVKVHVRHIFEKLGVRSRREAAALARRGS